MTDSDPVTRLNAALEGRYAIERELGEGGMATVYLADDLKHQRKVALKVLKPELAAVVGAERFLLHNGMLRQVMLRRVQGQGACQQPVVKAPVFPSADSVCSLRPTQ